MRVALLTTVAFLAAAPSYAAVITETGTPIGPANTEYYAALDYSFAPITVPGTVTAISLTYNGSVVPGVSAFGLSGLTSYSLTPYAQIANVNANSSLSVMPPYTAVAGAPVTIITSQPHAYLGSPLTVSANLPVNSFNTAGLSTGPISFEVQGYTIPGNYVYPTGTIGSIDVTADASQVDTGSLTLAVTYTASTVPEPMSVALLGAGLLGLVGARRRLG